MSDLSATNCGCDCERQGRSSWGNNSCIWIIILLLCCGGGNGFGRGNGCGDDSCLWIIILLFCCGGWGNGCGNSYDNGCC